MTDKTAIIIGAGPAGLTAALELLERTDIRPIVFETSEYMGGIARTVEHHGNRIDIGGHRFFSKSDRVMNWWLEILPLQKLEGVARTISYHRQSRDVETGEGPDPEATDAVMLVRSRKSRIYFARKFFDYPISLSPDTLLKLGPFRAMKIGFSYLRSMLFPIRNEKSLEDFFINRFGRELYLTFFKAYTEKVWGVPCNEISAEWGAQRVKGLSISTAIIHFLRQLVPARRDIGQKGTETSLIEQFLYPKYGPGQMWEEVARRILEKGGEIHTGHRVVGVTTDGDSVRGVRVRRLVDGVETELAGDYVFSTMPVRHLVRALDCEVPDEIREITEGLVYRDFVTVGLLLSDLTVKDPVTGGLILDNWIYIQEPDVRVGRLQVFNNWSPYMVSDPGLVWVGLEYFCDAGDDLWTMRDDDLASLGAEELERIRIARRDDVLDSVVIRMPKTYPAYFGTYDRFDEVCRFVDRFDNLFLLGRNGMHRYNNQDHSMLTAMVAVDNIVEGRRDKSNLWEINTEDEYHEER